jgi:transcriptional regulator of NAD metabolism
MGYEILPTHTGYVVKRTPLVERVFRVKHNSNETENELKCIVENGGAVMDVYVWHKVYGKIAAPLNIFSALQVKQFIEGVRSGKSVELMQITGGYHYHTVRAESDEVLDRIEAALAERGYLTAEAE